MAAIRAEELGINPGGDVTGVDLPEGFEPPEEYRDRLLSHDECQAFGRQMRAALSLDK